MKKLFFLFSLLFITHTIFSAELLAKITRRRHEAEGVKTLTRSPFRAQELFLKLLQQGRCIALRSNLTSYSYQLQISIDNPKKTKLSDQTPASLATLQWCVQAGELLSCNHIITNENEDTESFFKMGQSCQHCRLFFIKAKRLIEQNTYNLCDTPNFFAEERVRTAIETPPFLVHDLIRISRAGRCKVLTTNLEGGNFKRLIYGINFDGNPISIVHVFNIARVLQQCTHEILPHDDGATIQKYENPNGCDACKALIKEPEYATINRME